MVVFGLWLAARLAFFNGYYTEDAPGYVSDAIAIAGAEYQARHHVNGLNLGTYGPVALPLLVFGKTDAALSVWPLFCSLLGLVSVTGIARQFFGRGFGLLAGLLYATYPGDIYFSTVVMPDAIQSGWLSLSMLLVTLSFTLGSDHGFDLRPQGGDLRPRFPDLRPPFPDLRPHRLRLLLAGGAAMGVCHLIRANGILLLPIGLMAVAALSWVAPRATSWDSLRDIARQSLVFIAGWMLVFVLEGLAYLWTVGDFLFRFHIVDRHYGSATSIAQWGLNTHPLTIPYSAFAPLAWWRFGGWGTFNPDQAYHGLLFTLAALTLTLGTAVFATTSFANRRGAPAGSEVGTRGSEVRLAGSEVGTWGSEVGARLVLAAFWFAWPLLYHQFGSQSLTDFIPIHRLSRHLVVYAPGAIIACVAGCAVLWRAATTRAARRVLVVAGGAGLAVHLALNVQAEEIAYGNYHRIKDTYTRIRDRLPAGTTTIIADPGDLGFFDFWLNPLGGTRVRLEAFANYARCEDLHEGVVLTYSNPGWERLAAPAIQETVARLPCLLTPPEHWRLLYDGYPERVFVIDPPASR